MKTLKEHQPSMNVAEQIDNLKDLGLIIHDEDYARKVLNEISYFRLIKAYCLGLKDKNGNYHHDVSFEQIVSLYHFNADFRQLTFQEIERIEVKLRCQLANHISEKYGVMGYMNQEAFADYDYYKSIMCDVEGELERNSKAPFVKNFRENYEGGYLPIYALVEVFSFGTLSKFYKNLKNPDKKAIAQAFGVGYTYLESWIESIAYVRNICAHYGRLYNARLSKTPQLYKEYAEAGVKNNRIFGVLLCMKHLLKDDGWNSYVNQIECLIDAYKDVDIGLMGFPTNWKDCCSV